MATILVADDRATNRQLLVSILGYYFDHRVLEANDGAEALEIARAERPDLLILDLDMPRLNGAEVVRALRQDPGWVLPEVIFYTATYLLSEIQPVAEELGVRHVLQKPAPPEQILASVDEALGARARRGDGLEPIRPRADLRRLPQPFLEREERASRLTALIELTFDLASENDVQTVVGMACRAARASRTPPGRRSESPTRGRSRCATSPRMVLVDAGGGERVRPTEILVAAPELRREASVQLAEREPLVDQRQEPGSSSRTSSRTTSRRPCARSRGSPGLLQTRCRDQLDDSSRDFLDPIVGAAQRMEANIDDMLKLSRVRCELFQNLIDNAIKYRGSEPLEVEVRVGQESEFWRISVRDNGIGISPEFSKRIFQIFRRLHTREEYPGTGIGLAICKKIVEFHGGRLWVESEAGRGCEFCFTLPR